MCSCNYFTHLSRSSIVRRWSCQTESPITLMEISSIISLSNSDVCDSSVYPSSRNRKNIFVDSIKDVFMTVFTSICLELINNLSILEWCQRRCEESFTHRFGGDLRPRANHPSRRSCEESIYEQSPIMVQRLSPTERKTRRIVTGLERLNWQLHEGIKTSSITCALDYPHR